MAESNARPSIFWALLFLMVTITVGAHLSAIPLVVAKIFVAVCLVGLYAFFTVRIVTSMQIAATGPRAFVGLLIAIGTVYATWAMRIPALSGWETAFTANPSAILDAIVGRASSIEISKGFGAGTSTSGPSWLLLGTYIFEAAASLGIMVLGSLLAFPDKKGDATEAAQKPERLAA